MRAGAPARERGFTLMELVVALGVSGLAIAAAMALLVSQQRSYAATSADRAQQEAGRMALKELVGKLRGAGYGVDPNLVLDFGPTAVVPRPNLIAPATTVQQSSYACANPVRCRDSTTGSDEVVFLTRNPAFSRVASAVDTDKVTLTGEMSRDLQAGQILQVSCMGGAQVRAYVTVAQAVAGVVNPDPAKDVDVQLSPGQAAGGLPVFPFENSQLTDSCFSLSGGVAPMVTKVDRFRFYVAWYDPQGNVVPAQTLGARPYLMLDQGLRDPLGTPELIPVAPDVEDLQLTYLYPPAGAGLGLQPVGASVGTSAADEPFAITTAVVPPAMDDAPDAASRTTGHPANIQAVRVSVVVRSAEADVGLATVEDRTLPTLGNRAAFQGVPYYRRSVFETTVALRNLQSQAFVYPTVSAAGGEGMNLGGG
jgi:type IV pilus assembly protein PilW